MERRQAILTTVRAHGAVSIHELARLTGSSEVTVRRALRILEVEGQLSRRHGGAIALGGSLTDDKAPADELTRFAAAGVDLRVTGVASTRAAST